MSQNGPPPECSSSLTTSESAPVGQMIHNLIGNVDQQPSPLVKENVDNARKPLIQWKTEKESIGQEQRDYEERNIFDVPEFVLDDVPEAEPYIFEELKKSRAPRLFLLECFEGKGQDEGDDESFCFLRSQAVDTVPVSALENTEEALITDPIFREAAPSVSFFSHFRPDQDYPEKSDGDSDDNAST